jgi:hypothetical protein
MASAWASVITSTKAAAASSAESGDSAGRCNSIKVGQGPGSLRIEGASSYVLFSLP